MQTILVPIDGDERHRHLLRTTLALAGRLKAHVEVLHARPDPQDLLHRTGMSFPGDMRESVMKASRDQSEELARRVRAMYDEVCAETGVRQVDEPPFPDEASVVWRDRTGTPSMLVALRGRLADLIVLNRPTNRAEQEVVEAALLETGRPVLLIPPEWRGDASQIGCNVAIGWNGSTVAARAVMAAAPFLETAASIVILTTGEERDDRLTTRDLQRHLAWHGRKADIRTFEERSGRVSDPMLAEARDFGADLLVLGGYGTSVTRNVILGGVTSAMLKRADLPLLMAH